MISMTFVEENIFSPLPPQLSELDIHFPSSIEFEIVEQNISGLSDNK